MNFTVHEADGHFTMRSGERYQDQMDKGECLDLIARILYGSSPIENLLRTKEEHEAFWASFQLPAMSNCEKCRKPIPTSEAVIKSHTYCCEHCQETSR
jgi:formamidopyrimidine-DNA glycosylase